MSAIPEYFPQERMRNSKERMARLFRLETVRPQAYRVLEYGQVLFPVPELLNDLEKYLEHQLDGIRLSSRYEGDYIPALVPLASCLVVPSAFGAELVWPECSEPLEQKHPWVKPVISDASDAWRLKKPRVTDGLGQKLLEHVRLLQDRAGGKYPLRMANIQGPLINAGYLWGDQNFIFALYDHPREVHATLDVVTDFMIALVKAQRAIVSDFVPILSYPDWIPDGCGIGIADDYAAVLSPSLYEEFALPYNNRLSDEFGGIVIHSCGRSEGTWDAILKHKNLRGVNFELPDNSFEAMVGKFSGKALIAPHAPFRRRQFADDVSYVRFLLDGKRDDTSLLITLERDLTQVSSVAGAADVRFEEAYELLARYQLTRER